MAINLKVLIPEATVNYILNPSPRFNSNGWLGSPNVAVTRSTDRSRFSVASIRVITPGQALNEGVYFRVSALANISSNVTVSVYVRGTDGKVRIRLIDNPRGQQWISDAFPLTDSRWNRIEISGQTTGSNDMRLYVETADAAPRAITFYVDGAQMELKPYSTSYCDGNQPGCQWNVMAYNSQAYRTGDTRYGGKWVGIVGPCRPDNDIYVTLLDGLGMPPWRNNIQEWSNADGAYYQSSKAMERLLMLNFWIKNKQTIINRNPDLTPLHELRQELIDIIKPFKTVGNEPFLLQYQDEGGDRPLFIWCRYDSGLESSWDVRNEFSNSFPLRLLAVDPMWWEDTMDVFPMAVSNTFTGSNGLDFCTRVNGVWGVLPPDSNGNRLTSGGIPAVIGVNPANGKIYLCGNSYRAPGTSGPYGPVITWDGVSFTLLGGGATDLNSSSFRVRCIDFAPDGKIYVGGAFTKIGPDISANNVALYNPATDSWSALGTGLNNTCRGICVADNGQVYVVGDFTTAGGVTCNYIARWDGLQWRTVGSTSGFDFPAYTICRGINRKTLYVGGNFLNSNGGSVRYNGVCSLNTDTNLLSAMGGGIPDATAHSTGAVTCLAVGKDGTVYMGKSNTISPTPAGFSLISKYTGANLWTPVGSGLQVNIASSVPVINNICISKTGVIYVSGKFTASGNTTFVTSSVGDCFAMFNGSAWVPMEIGLNASNYLSVYIVEGNNGELYAADNVTLVPAATTITNNGTAPFYPKIYYTGAGTVLFISNAKTGESIYLNLTVYANEEIFFDFSLGKVISSIRGELQNAIMPGSEMRAMYALPGQNIYTAYVVNDVGGYMQAQIIPQHYSADAVVNSVPITQ